MVRTARHLSFVIRQSTLARERLRGNDRRIARCICKIFFRRRRNSLDNDATRNYIARRCARRKETSQLRWSGNARQIRLRCVVRLREGIHCYVVDEDVRAFSEKKDVTVLEQ